MDSKIKLKKLALADNDITNLGAEYLLIFLKQNPFVQELDIRYNRCDSQFENQLESFIAAFKAALHLPKTSRGHGKGHEGSLSC
ncbi:MAG: hypothetical protein ACKOAD_04235 [Gammaproteobacteria bacterium]